MLKNFLKQVFLAPRSIGALVPSSRFLAAQVVESAQACADAETTLIELGPGTGAISRPLIRSRRGQQRVILIEKNPHFLEGLRTLGGDFELVHACVTDIVAQVGALGVQKNIVIVSSIPWLSLPAEVRIRGQDALLELLKRWERVSLIQYTYAPQSPMEWTGVEAQLVGRVWLNVPPAWVWKYAAPDSR